MKFGLLRLKVCSVLLCCLGPVMAGGRASIRKRSQGDREGWPVVPPEFGKRLTKSIKCDLLLLECMEKRLTAFDILREDLCGPSEM